jgi:DNA-binding response OmpR family regulator
MRERHVLEGDRPKVLIVDDEDGVRSLVRMTLGDSYDILQASTAAQALIVVGEHRPHLVLLDVMLPDGSGVDVCRVLKHDPATASILVLMLTAKAQQSDLVEAERAGADGYFTKPFSPVALIRRVEQILGGDVP